MGHKVECWRFVRSAWTWDETRPLRGRTTLPLVSVLRLADAMYTTRYSTQSMNRHDQLTNWSPHRMIWQHSPHIVLLCRSYYRAPARLYTRCYRQSDREGVVCLSTLHAVQHTKPPTRKSGYPLAPHTVPKNQSTYLLPQTLATHISSDAVPPHPPPNSNHHNHRQSNRSFPRPPLRCSPTRNNRPVTKRAKLVVPRKPLIQALRVKRMTAL